MQKNNDLPPYKRPVLPDAELLLWEKWIQIRKEETTELAKRTQRPPVDLAMNLLQNVREDKERKTVLEDAKIRKKVGVRGSLWEQAPRLKQGCRCDPVYEIKRTRAEMGRPPVIEHIFVPTLLEQTEMGMAGEPERGHFADLNVTYEQYRKKRAIDLEKRIRKIDPFRPTTKNLMIKGERPKKPPPKIPPLPLINVIDSLEYSEDALSGVYAMRINNTVLIKDIPGQKLDYLQTLKQQEWYENCTSWTYYFNVPVGRVGRSKLFVQNLGTVSLRYCWRKIKNLIPYIPVPLYEQEFYFNKNENVLSPGQSREICFSFVSNKPGMFNEYWEFSLWNICFFDTMADKLTINLFADAVEDIAYTKRKTEIIKTRIHRKALSNIMLEIINVIFDNVFLIPPQVYPYKKYFLEAEIFVMKNPVCFYHQTEVAKMSNLYTEMVPGETWDLSIATWRETMMAKEYEERMKYYGLLRLSHAECLKPWYEGDGLLKEKYRAIKFLLGQLADNFDKEYSSIYGFYTTRSSISGTATKSVPSIPLDSLTRQKVRNIFFLHAYEHVATTIELCAGVLSSLDLNRWIEFDFCRT